MEQLNEDNENYKDEIKISISKESIPNKINISKNVKFHENLNSTLYELMDEPSYSMINVKFPQIKPIIFEQKDFYNIKSQKDIKSILRNSIPDYLVKTRTPSRKRNLSVYTPQKIKNGRRFFMSQKKNNKNTSLIEGKSCEMKKEQKLTNNNFGPIKNIYISNNKYEKKNDKNAYKQYYDNNYSSNCNDSKEVITVNSIYTQKMISPLSKKKINRLRKKVNQNIKVYNLGYIKINNK